MSQSRVKNFTAIQKIAEDLAFLVVLDVNRAGVDVLGLPCEGLRWHHGEHDADHRGKRGRCGAPRDLPHARFIGL